MLHDWFILVWSKRVHFGDECVHEFVPVHLIDEVEIVSPNLSGVAVQVVA